MPLEGCVVSGRSFRADIDAEPPTAGDARAIACGLEDLKASRALSHDEVLREFGV